jgi:oligo-1,6-glucosidase/alpha-glucosidase
MNHPDNFPFVKDLRRVLDEYSDPERFLVGEISSSLEILKRYCGEGIDGIRTDGLHLVFLFKSLRTKFDASAFHSLVSDYERYFTEPYTPTWVFSNHDQMRRISKLGDDQDKAKLNATLQMTARGVPFIYYGEEIGMANHRIPLKNAKDPIGQRYSKIPQLLVNLLTRGGSLSLNRDDCRTPMQWNDSPNAGFCTDNLTPWLPISPGSETLNVASGESDPNSLLNCYRTLLRIRRETPALHSGEMHILPLFLFGDILSYQRIFGEQVVQVWLNFSKKTSRVNEIGQNPELLFSTNVDDNPLQESTLYLQPYQGVVLELSL